MPLVPAFSFSLDSAVVNGLVVLGHFDGVKPSIAFAPTLDTVTIYSASASSSSSSSGSTPSFAASASASSQSLSINQQITCLDVGDMDDGGPQHESLLIGTKSNLMAYNVETNSDMFYKDVADGVSAVRYGHVSSVQGALAMVGGNCAIQGFDALGQEVFWTVTNDVVRALDFRGESASASQLLAGTQDREIRVYDGADAIVTVVESDAVRSLQHVSRTSLFGFALDNGTVGAYDDASPLWSTKSMREVTCTQSFDLDGDGVPELVVGYADGSLEVHKDETGQVVYRDSLDGGIAGLVRGDFRQQDEELVCVSSVGEVRGYVPAEREIRDHLMDVSAHESELDRLFAERQDLLTQLASYAANSKKIKSAPTATAASVPPDTAVDLRVEPDAGEGAIMLHLETNNDTVLKTVLVVSDSLLANRCIAVHPARPMSTLSVPLRPSVSAGAEAQLDIKAVVGHRSSTQDHVFELSRTLARFAHFERLHAPYPVVVPESCVSFAASERTAAIESWLESAFGTRSAGGASSPKVLFRSVLDPSLVVGIDWIGEATTGTITIRTESMDLAGEVLQDMARYLQLEHVNSTASFPSQLDAFGEVLTSVKELTSLRQRMSIDIAESSNLLKTIVVKAEDARLQGEMEAMGRAYTNMMDLNRELIAEYNKRASNHAELQKNLREVKKMIQRAAQMRVGRPQASVIAACRQALKQGNVMVLLNVVRNGKG